jgi:2-polyprenyl-3-methyl-5-hydroxy-6-metoxy-1,4-benzoquinol methylase
LSSSPMKWFFDSFKPGPFSRILDKKRYYGDFRKITDSKKVYWISPERIVYAMNYLKVANEKKKGFVQKNFTEKMRGKSINGDWDKTNYRFTDLPVYKSIKQTIDGDEELRNSTLFRHIQNQAQSPPAFWSATNANNLQKLCDHFKPKLAFNSTTRYSDAIDVNIGRNGQYLFQNNACALSIAKILNVKLVPVRVFVRHKQWEELRESVLNFMYQDVYLRGFLFQPIVHPDFVDFSTMQNKCQETMDSIKPHLTKKNGTLLDVGANLGFFCHKFEDLGYRCFAVENERNTFRILERIRDAENKTFTVINKSIFEADFLENKHFDVVLALNIFHHFLKEKTLFYQLKKFLQNLKTDMMFFSAADCRDEQMRNAYRNYSESEFVDFILQLTSLNASKVISTGRLNRPVYKLSG